MAILRTYHRPTTIDEALSLLARTDVRLVPLAGGSHLIGALETRALPDVDGVLDLSRLGLDRIELTTERARVGAMVTLTELTAHATLADLAGGILARAARGEGPINLRNGATVGGLVASPAHDSELYAALLALGASVVSVNPAGETTQPLAAVGTIDGLVIAVEIPLLDARGGLARVAITPSDRPIVAAVAVRGDGFARIALCGVADRPLLHGQPVAPRTDFKASAAYRKAMVPVVVARAADEAER